MKSFKNNYKKLLTLLMILCLVVLAAGCTAQTAKEPEEPQAPEQQQEDTNEEPKEETEGEVEYPTRQAALPFTYERESKNQAADEKYAPRVITLENGVQVQKTPFNTSYADGKLVKSWNNIYMNADNRGCNACHTLEDALEEMDTYHGIIYFGYPVEQTIENCFGCHGFYTTRLRDSIHTIHDRSDKFDAMKGSCQSCHYLDDEGNYLRWDYVKYDVLFGITDIAATDMNNEFSWNQTKVTDTNKYYKSIKSAPGDWLTDDSQITPDIYENWTIKVTGDIDNPFEMTLPEMVEKFGTETHLMKSHCTVNGPGQAMIFQAEVTGIPVSKIMEYVKPHDDVNMFYPVGDDGYCYNISTDVMLKENGLLVTEMNGKPLSADQGHPVAFWGFELSAGNFTKRIAELRFDQSDATSWDFYGDFTDPTTGLGFDKPNVGILTATSGQIFKKGEPVHLEGYADAWNEPITQIDMSFDHGETWIEYKIDNATTHQWVYWMLDIKNELEPGSYLIKLRAHSTMPDGTDRVSPMYTKFMFNIQ